MQIRKFFGENTRDVLKQVRDALGANALVLSNRQVAGGIEIMAVAEREAHVLSDTVSVTSPSSPEPAPIEKSIATLTEKTAGTMPSPSPALKPARTARPREMAANHPLYEALSQQLKVMRSLLESQLSGFAWGELARRDPIKAELMRTLLGAGFSPQLSRQLVEAMPKGVDHDKGLKWLKAALAHNLRVVEPGADFITRGGVYALVGPTGVGKTTTVAKLAARAVLKFGAERVALITTDSYRIGAHEQLRIYGRILNVPVHAVKDETELQLTLADLTRSHLILIDTVGMSQRDRRITEQIEFLCGRGSKVRRHLLLPATAQNVTLDDIVRAYRGSGMDGVILSKIDESVSIAPAIDCLIRHGLDLHYVTNGQKVPEDLHLANALYLVDRAFKGQEESQTLLDPFESLTSE
jgi:flagellar biosynthesis protein FlhF